MKMTESNSRREFLKFLGVGSLALSQAGLLGALTGCESSLPKGVSPSFKDDLILSPGLLYHVLASWGDSINDKEVFGFNNDYIEIIPLGTDDLLMWVNHEYVNPLFATGPKRSRQNIEKEMSLVGGTIMRVKKTDGKWKIEQGDARNRGVRGNTPIPFAGEARIMGKSEAVGTLANCAGGKTPWNTFLTCEENYHAFYGERQPDGSVKGSMLAWETVFPHPPEHYGWVVEVDPFSGKAKKHVNLGRFAHESATCAKAKDGRVAVYSGDDKKDEHLYKFVSSSGDNFDKGVLYAANIEKGQWLPLDLKLSPSLKKRFKNQTEVMINAREAAKMLGATPLARPEDIEIHPFTGDVFVALTNNKKKGNYHGEILKISEKNKDHGSENFTSKTFYTGGAPGGLTCPDNMAFDRNGNLWVASDISGYSIGKEPYKRFGNNGLYVIPATGPKAGRPIQMASAPVDAELTGLKFSPDQKTLFLSVQHPGENTKDLAQPTSVWPGGKTPKPSVVAIEGKDLEYFTS